VVATLLDGSKRVADSFPRPRLIIWPEAAIPDFFVAPARVDGAYHEPGAGGSHPIFTASCG